jgi:hypothetical protein
VKPAKYTRALERILGGEVAPENIYRDVVKSGTVEDVKSVVEFATKYGQGRESQELRSALKAQAISDALKSARAGGDSFEGLFSGGKFKKALFGDGDVAESLELIYRVSKQMDSTQRYASNPSGTARGMVGLTGPLVTAAPLLEYGRGVLMGEPSGSFAVAAVLSGALAGGQRAYGALLASPKFATWLSRAPKTDDPLKIRNYIGRLSTIATQTPALAADVEALQADMEASLGSAGTGAATPGVLAQ